MNDITVDFPLRGEWTAIHTPAEKVPSHGIDVWGQTYAYDFMQKDWSRKGFQFYRTSTLRYCTVGVSVKNCHGFGRPVHSPVDGTVVVAKDGLQDHRRLHPILDLAAVYARGIAATLSRRPDKHKLIGNHLIVKIEGIEAFAFFAHLKINSIRVRQGEKVHRGQQLARVGHTGNSTAPHLHFHIMDRVEIITARGLPCNFEKYESFTDGRWLERSRAMPAKGERIRAKEA